MVYRPWTAPEISALLRIKRKLTESATAEQIKKAYNRWAEANGYNTRRGKSIRAQLALSACVYPPGGIAWQTEEAEKLMELAGDYPLELLTQFFNRWACQLGLPRRTQSCIRHKLKRLRLSAVPTGLWIKAIDLARITHRSGTSVLSWITDPTFPAEMTFKGPRAHYIRRDGVLWLASNHPRRFSSMTRDELFLLLEDAKLVDQVRAAIGNHQPNACRVVCLSRGIVYPSISAAAKAVPMHRASFGRALRRNPVIDGQEYRVLFSAA